MAGIGDILNRVRDCRPGSALDLSYFHGACDEPLCGWTLPQLLESAARSRDNRVLYRILDYDQTITAKELLKQADTVSKALLSCDIKKGDVVMIVGVDDMTFYTVMQGVFAIGAVFLNPYLYDPKDVALLSILKTSKPKLIVCGPSDQKMVVAALDKEKERCGQFVRVYYPGIEEMKKGRLHHNHDNIYAFASFIKAGESVSDEDLTLSKARVSQDDSARLLSSSGTTGEPKLTFTSHHTLVNFAKFTTIRRNPLNKPEIEAWSSPLLDDDMPVSQSLCLLYHWDRDMTGIVLPSALDGYDELMTIIEQEKITTLLMYPYMIVGIPDHASREKYNLSTLKAGWLTSQTVSADICRKISELFPDFVIEYGIAEFFSATQTSPEWSTTAQFINSAGYALPHVEVKVVGEDGATLPIGMTGEVLLRGWPLCNGYINNVTVLGDVVDTALWYHSGDMGKMDATGHVEIMGRKSDCIRFKKRGGVIYPKVIEAAVKTHESVRDAKVIGMEDDILGSKIIACVVLAEGLEISNDDLDTFITTKLTERYKPDAILFFDQLPRIGPIAKVSRKKLLEFVKEKLLLENENRM